MYQRLVQINLKSILDINTIKQFYLISPKNCKSLTIFECIDAAGNPSPLLLICISGQKIMADWFPEKLLADTCIISTENGFTTDHTALVYL